MSKPVALGKAIRAIRTAKEANDPERFAGSRFAIKVGMSHGHLCNIEAARKNPPAEVIERIAAALGVDVDAISYIPDHTEVPA